MFVSRPHTRFPLWPMIAGTVLLAVPFHLRPENFIVDDGYFYPQIARYIVHHQGSTFNGIMLTNGYHPLWMVLCVIAAWFTTAAMPLLQILATVQDLLLLACVIALALLARKARLRGAAFGCLVILFFNMVLGIWRMLESPLALLLQIAALVLVTNGFSAIPRLKKWRDPLLGVTLGLALLARLDLIFFALTVLGYHAFQEAFTRDNRLSQRLWRALIPAALAGFCLIPYLLWNWQTFHHLLPISGAIKSTFPHVQSWRPASFTWPVIFAILINGTLLLKQHRTAFDTICLLTAAAAALHLVYTMSFGGLAPWYLTTGYLSVALCIIWTFTALIAKIPALGVLELPAAALLFLLFLAIGTTRSMSNLSYTRLLTGHASLNRNYQEPKRALALQLTKTLPRDSRLFLFDAPGGVAYFSDLSILPVDGLVADYAYNRELAEWGPEEYARRKSIGFIVAPLITGTEVYDRLDLKASRTPAGEIVELEAPLTHVPAGRITLPDGNLLFTFTQINPDLERAFPKIGVWRILPAAGGHAAN